MTVITETSKEICISYEPGTNKSIDRLTKDKYFLIVTDSFYRVIDRSNKPENPFNDKSLLGVVRQFHISNVLYLNI